MVDDVVEVEVVEVVVVVVDEVSIGHVHALPSHEGRPFAQVGGGM